LFEVYKRLRGPQLVTKLFPCNQLPGPAEKFVKDLKGLGAQLELHPMLVQFTRAWAELERPKREGFGRILHAIPQQIAASFCAVRASKSNAKSALSIVCAFR